MATRELTTVNVEQLKIRLRVIAGRATGVVTVDTTLHMAEGVNLAEASGTEAFVFALREIRAALHSAEQLALRFPGGTPLRLTSTATRGVLVFRPRLITTATSSVASRTKEPGW